MVNSMYDLACQRGTSHLYLKCCPCISSTLPLEFKDEIGILYIGENISFSHTICNLGTLWTIAKLYEKYCEACRSISEIIESFSLHLIRTIKEKHEEDNEILHEMVVATVMIRINKNLMSHAVRH